MEVGEIEQLISCLYSDEVSEQDLLLAKNNLLLFLQNIENLGFIIENFDSFAQQSSVIFFMNVFYIWIDEHFDSISDELIEVLKQFLFVTCTNAFTKFKDEYATALIRTQTAFILKVFPSKWETFWNDFFGFEESFILRFLNVFCAECGKITPERLQTFSEYKNCLISCGAVERIYSLVFEKMSQKIGISFSILSSLCQWTSYDWIFQEQPFGLLLAGLEDNQCAEYVFRTFNNIIVRNMPDDSKIELIQNLGDTEKISNIVTQMNDVDVYCEAAKLIYSSGLILLENEESQQYYSVAIQFMPISQEVARILCPFISTFTKLYPESVSTTVETVFELMTSFFNEVCESEENYFPNISCHGYLLDLCNLVSSSIIADKDGCVSSMDEIISGNFSLEENPGFCTAVIFLLMNCQRTTSGFTDILKHYLEQIFAPLEIPSPIPTQYQFLMHILFKLFTDNIRLNIFPPDKIKSFCNSLIEYMTLDGLPDQVLFECSSFVRIAIDSKKGSFEITPELVQQFIETMNPTHCGVGGALLQYIDVETRMQLITSYIESLSQEIASGENQENACLCLLNFICEIRKDVGLQANEMLLDAVKACLPLAEGKDHILRFFIQASAVRLESLVLDRLLEITEYLCGQESISFFCKRLSLCLQAISAKEKIVSILPLLMEIVFKHIDFVIYSIGSSRNDRFVIPFFELLSKLQDAIPEELFGHLLNKVELFLTKNYSMLFLFDSCIMFLSSLIHIEGITEMLIQRFIPLSFNIVFLPDFDPNEDLYNRLCLRVSKFHRDLSNKNPDLVHQVVAASLAPFGLNEEAAATYFAIHNGDSRQSNAEIRKFFEQLMKTKRMIDF